MNKKPSFIHIYFGTAGAAGLYIKAIINALGNNVPHNFIVNYYYPDIDARRWFFKYTELSGPNLLRNNLFTRFAVRYLELVYSLVRCLFLFIRKRPKVLNYNLISQHYVEYIFLLLSKKILKINITLTLHDVIPFESNYGSFFSPIKVKQKIILLADNIILHNNSSLEDLNKTFLYCANVLFHSFPVMNPTIARGFDNLSHTKTKKSSDLVFLFVGHPRKEKGLDILYNAWLDVQKKFRNCRLVIACKFQDDNPLSIRFSQISNVEIINKYLSDYEYFQLIEGADCVVLPYIRGTNSGIPGTVASLGTALIASDIPMFNENALIPKCSLFESCNSSALSSKIMDFIKHGPERYTTNVDDFTAYNMRVEAEIREVYMSIENILSKSH